MNKIFSRVFMWLSVGLFVSFGVGFYVSTNENLIVNVFGKYYVFLILLELACAFVFSIFIKKLSKPLTIILYLVYSFITGLTLSSIFLVYEIYSIVFIFLIVGIIFAILSIYGYKTDKDITKISTLLMFGLIGLVIMTFINIFIFKSNLFDILLTIISIVIFMGYIIYDINVLKRRLYDIDEDKLAVYGAFQLYLDFINLFFDLLRLFGDSKD
ncbi:MAG: Bax inhibitor-1/YccA family protein [bacterium]|nr:Bax inhibitor-1/YccA family protein [bacterium]